LKAALEEKGCFTANDRHDEDGLWYATFEILDCVDNQNYTPEKTICALIDRIEALGEETRRLWTTCVTRKFDIGYECGDNPRMVINELTTDTLRRIVAVNASLKITLYQTDSKVVA
jgi:hypothetical protein